ncbi:DNA-binding transcriptional ArsR family regulator [Prauserella sediminis]|uniref:DNA-binding transcriptional ArsR family regulator n=1 Tax=Prauserella sediminis TaxID=577680 RepID=A0A839XK79_9PSEU|nr:winged helix-turn-helix domain-containing protein [Prauserella sediminis]MBB3664332.1 DNA-binding transcriptional ArsR family regulator [Prauserella sediminis]
MGAGRRTATEAEANALASGIRLRIIRLTHHEALTNKEIARRLDRDPATTLYHVRKLVATGFLVTEVERRGARGAKEIPYRSTGLSWRLSGPWNAPVEDAMLEAFLTEIADLEPAALHQTRAVARLPEARLAEFRGRLAELIDEFAAGDEEDAPPESAAEQPGATAIYLALYPSG